jgi:hypothetical protein
VQACTPAAAPVAGKGRAVLLSAASTCAGVSVGLAEIISAAVPATSGDEKLVPSVGSLMPSV